MSVRQASSQLRKHVCGMLDQAWLQAGARFQHTVPTSSWGATQALEQSDNFYDTSVEHYANLPLRMISLSDVRFPFAGQTSTRLPAHSPPVQRQVCVQMLKQGLHYHAQPNIEESILESANAARQEVPLHFTVQRIQSLLQSSCCSHHQRNQSLVLATRRICENR